MPILEGMMKPIRGTHSRQKCSLLRPAEAIVWPRLKMSGRRRGVLKHCKARSLDSYICMHRTVET